MPTLSASPGDSSLSRKTLRSATTGSLIHSCLPSSLRHAKDIKTFSREVRQHVASVSVRSCAKRPLLGVASSRRRP